MAHTSADFITIPKALLDNAAFDAEVILADLVAHGLSGQELLARFKERTQEARSVIQPILDESDVVARSVREREENEATALYVRNITETLLEKGREEAKSRPEVESFMTPDGLITVHRPRLDV